jgi:predicted enzyme related to lactoylglutathione lyase
MPEITGSQVGHFCWFELGTTDQEAAKQFYADLFGWTCNDMPLGPGSFYTTFQLGGKDVGAAYTLQPDQQSQGVPPHWMTYVAVASADDAAACAASLGGNVLAPPFDVFDLGRMAIIQDPTGAAISIWQAKKHFGVRVHAELNAFGWSELLTRDTAAATKFYTGLFGWDTMVSTGMGAPYTHWRVNGKDIGGMMAINEFMGPIPSHWMNYIPVPNCDDTIAKATSLGGKALCPPMDVPNVGRFAPIQDPQGAVLSVITLAPMHK